MNQHILELCKLYLASEKNPEYAILLKGKWGCGKTWFVKEFMQKMIEEENVNEKEIMYISAFGAKDIDDLYLRFFQALYPIKSSPLIKYGGRVIKSFAENKIGISFGEVENKIKSEDLKKRLVIIDDIERSDISPTYLFGGLSELIIEDNVRVIFIANEEEYKEKFKGEKQNYERIREKIIGYTVEILPNLDKAIDSFIKEFGLDEDIDGVKDIIINVMNKLGISNLRVVRQAIQSYEYIFRCIEDLCDESYKKELIELYLVLFLQYSCGELKRENIKEAIISYYKNSEPLKKYLKNKESNKDNTPTDIITREMYFNQLPLKNFIEDIIFNCNFNNEKIRAEVKLDMDHKKVLLEEEDIRDNHQISILYYLMQNWRDLSKEQFKKTLKILENEIKEGKYNVGELLNFIDIMFIFSKYRIIPYDKEYITNMVKEIIDKNIIKTINNFPNDGYGGWLFSNLTVEEFIKIKDILKEYNNNRRLVELKKQVNEYIDDLEHQYKNLISCLSIEGAEPDKYIDLAIVKEINIEKMFDKFKNLDSMKKIAILNMFKSRYGMRYSNGEFKSEYYSEYENINKFKELYKAEIDSDDSMYNPKFIVDKQIYDDMKKLLEYMKKSMNNNIIK